MELKVKSAQLDLSYQVNLQDPLFELWEEQRRVNLARHFVKEFGLKLNDLKIDSNRLSDNLIYFSKFSGPLWLEVFFGLEQALTRIRNPQYEPKVTHLLGKVNEPLKNGNIDSQRMTIQQHFSTEGDINSFLESLNPDCPTGFQNLLEGRGVFYTLKMAPQNLTMHITLVNSLYIQGGLFVSIENVFSPNVHDFENALRVAWEQYNFALNELNIILGEG